MKAVKCFDPARFAVIFGRAVILTDLLYPQNVIAPALAERDLMMPEPPKLFVSYAREDEPYKNELVKQLHVLEDQSVIANWHDGLLIAGEQWDETIVAQVNAAQIILLLISPDFLNSEYIHNVEMKRASERHEAGEVVVIPVLVRKINSWENVSFGKLKLGALNALPTGAKFISSWRKKDDAFADVAAGIQEVAKNLNTGGDNMRAVSAIPRPPSIGFVTRQDVERQRDLVERLKEELSPEKQQVVTLWGVGGVGKTMLAAEVARELEGDFAGRVVWTSAYDRADYTFTALLDEIATQLGQEDLRTLAPDKKAQAVCALACAQPTLVVLDNFETISPDEQTRCVSWLTREATCPALITTRERINGTRQIQVGAMSDEEATEFLNRLIEGARDKSAFTEAVRKQIIKTAEAMPYVMEWVFAQIDVGDDPKDVFADLTGGIGAVGERVFARSFNLPQLGDDGRAVLLALTLFVPSASRDALSQVAGFGNDTNRVREAIKRLGALRLIATNEGAGELRYIVEGLTRSLAHARLKKDSTASEFRQRFVAHFMSYAQAHKQPTPEDYNALEAEKANVLGAMDAAFELEDWSSIIQIANVVAEHRGGMLSVRGYWDEAIRRGEQGLEAAKAANSEWNIGMFANALGGMLSKRGNYSAAKKYYELAVEIARRLDIKQGLAATLHQLGMLAQAQGELDEARRLYDESLEIKKKLGDPGSIATTTSQIGIVLKRQGEMAESRAYHEKSLAIRRRLGDQQGIATDLHQLGMLSQELGELGEARRLYDESLEINKKLGNQSDIAGTVHQLGRLAELAGKKAEAVELFREALGIWEKLGSTDAKIARRSLERVEGEDS